MGFFKDVVVAIKLALDPAAAATVQGGIGNAIRGGTQQGVTGAKATIEQWGRNFAASAVEGVASFVKTWQSATSQVQQMFVATSNQGKQSMAQIAASANVAAAQNRVQAAQSRANILRNAQSTQALAKAQQQYAQAVQVQNNVIAKSNQQTAQTSANAWRGMFATFQAYIIAFTGIRRAFQFLQESVGAFASFDQRLQQSVAIMQNVDTIMREKLGRQAREVAKDLNLSADELAGTYYHLTSAGLNAEASLKSLPIVASFAKAGMMDVARGAELLTMATTSLGYKSTDANQQMANMARVADVLTLASKRSQGTIETFASSLTNKAGNSLRIFGKDVEEGAAALAVLANEGIRGSVAGERLDIFLRQVTQAAVKHADVFKAYGIQIFDATGHMKNMADIADDLTKALGHMSDEQQVIAIQQLGFQTRTIASVKAFIDNGDAIRNYEKDLRSAAGYADKIAKAQLLTPTEQWGLFKQKIVDVRREIGEQFVPVLLQLGQKMGDADDPKSLVGQLASFAKFLRDNQDGVMALGGAILWLVTAPMSAFFRLANGLANLIIFVLAPPVVLLAMGFSQLTLSIAAAETGLGMLIKLLTGGLFGQGMIDYGNHLAETTKKVDAFTEALHRAFLVSARELGDELFGDSPDGKPKIIGKPTFTTAKGLPGPPREARTGRALDLGNEKAEHASFEHKKTLLEELSAMIAKHTETNEDNQTAALQRLQRKFEDVYGVHVPAVVRQAFELLKKEIADEGAVAEMQKKLTILSKLGGKVSDVDSFIAALHKQQEALRDGNPEFKKYSEILNHLSLLHLGSVESTKANVKELEHERDAIMHSSIAYSELQMRIDGLQKTAAKQDNAKEIADIRQHIAATKDDDAALAELESQLESALSKRQEFLDTAQQIATLKAEQRELLISSEVWHKYNDLITAVQKNKGNPADQARIKAAEDSLIKALQDEQEHTVKGSKAWADYNRLILQATQLRDQFNKRDIEDRLQDIGNIEDMDERAAALELYIEDMSRLRDEAEAGTDAWEAYRDAVAKAQHELISLNRENFRQKLNAKIEQINGIDNEQDRVEALRAYKRELEDMAAKTEKGTEKWYDLQRAISRVNKEIHNLDTKKWEAFAKNIEDHLIKGFEKFWDVLIKGSRRGADAFEQLGRAILASMAGAISEYFKKKATEDFLHAGDEVAAGVAALADPLLMVTAPAHFAAAAKYAAMGTLWSAASAGAGAVGSAVGNSSHGLSPNSTEAAKNKTDNASGGTEINIYLDGIDPKNPRHQALVGQTIAEFAARGGKLNIKNS